MGAIAYLDGIKAKMPKLPKKKKRQAAMRAYKDILVDQKDFSSAVYNAVYDASPAGQRNPDEYSYWYVVELYPGYVIVCVGTNKHVKIPFTVDESGENITLSSPEQWVEVKQTWVPVSS